MNVRERINTLYRRLRPSVLVRDWHALLACVNERWELGRSDASLWQEARKGAATGRDPGDVLAQLLIEQAARPDAEVAGEGYC
jgi:hypothetical protein